MIETLSTATPIRLDRPSWLAARSCGEMTTGSVLFHAPPSVFQSPGGGENQLVQTGRHLEELGVTVRLFSSWTDRLEEAATGMRAVHRLLGPAVAERIIFDLGLVRSLGYYTGAVFQVYDPAYGVPIGIGGRYDDLLGQFGRPLPAVGFSLNVERLHIALTSEERGKPT